WDLWSDPPRELEGLGAEGGPNQRRLALSPDGKALAAGLSDIQLWDLSGEARELGPRLNPAPLALAFQPRPGSRALVSGAMDGCVRRWDLSAGPPQLAPLRGHEGTVFCLAFSPDGRALASGGMDRTVRLWGLGGSAPKEPVVLGRHESDVLALAFAPD